MKRIISLVAAMLVLGSVFTSCDEDDDQLIVKDMEVTYDQEYRMSNSGDPFAFFPSDYHGYEPSDVEVWYSGGRVDSETSTTLYLFGDGSFILTWANPGRNFVQAYGFYTVELGDTETGTILLKPVGHNETVMSVYNGIATLADMPLVKMDNGAVPMPTKEYDDRSYFEENQ